jgi:hypothetical protein
VHLAPLTFEPLTPFIIQLRKLRSPIFYLTPTIDLTVCLQNGISALNRDHERLMAKAARIAHLDGKVLLFSWAEFFGPLRPPVSRHKLFAAPGMRYMQRLPEKDRSSAKLVSGQRLSGLRTASLRRLKTALTVSSSINRVKNSNVFCEIIFTSKGGKL